MSLRCNKTVISVVAVLVIFLWVGIVQADCYSNTKIFDPDEGIIWNYPWSHTISELPADFVGASATIEIRVQVWAWGFYPNPARLDILCSDTQTFYANNPDYLVGSLTPSKLPNPSNFYTLTFPLKSNQISWLTNDKTLNFIVVANGGTYYLDHCKLTVCGSVPVTYTLTLQVNGQGTTTPTIGYHTYAEGEVVNLSATPDAGWQFTNWTGDVANPTAATTTTTINGNKTVTANFGSTGTTPSNLLLLLAD
jgi:hypothetical protein